MPSMFGVESDSDSHEHMYGAREFGDCEEPDSVVEPDHFFGGVVSEE